MAVYDARSSRFDTSDDAHDFEYSQQRRRKWPIEVVWNLELAVKQSEPAPGARRVQWNQFCDRRTVACDDDFLAGLGTLNQFRQTGLRFVDIHLCGVSPFYRHQLAMFS